MSARLRIVATVACLELLGCRAPRDPDLDRRVAEAQLKAEAGATEPAPAAEAAPAPAPAGARAKSVPAKGIVELRSYTNAEIGEILGRLSGEGEVIEAIIETERGSIHCTLDEAAAPQSVTNFVGLALGVQPWRDPDTEDLMETPFYRGLSFHRCVSNFIIQTGNPGTRRAGGPGWTIPREAGPAGAFERGGALAMVDAADDSHGSQFFITVRPSPSLEGKYAPFGRCGDLELVKAISEVDKLPAAGSSSSATRPVNPVKIRDIVLRRI